MTAFTTLAPLFRYPDEAYARRLDEARATVDEPDLDAFANAIAQLDLPAQQSAYTSTFDLAPSCSPYLGVHLFGDENRDRSRLMLGLRIRYVRSGIAVDGELPDHIAEVFAFAPYAESEEWDELRCFVLVPALKKMDEILRPTSNPYRLLVSAALHHSARGGDS